MAPWPITSAIRELPAQATITSDHSPMANMRRLKTPPRIAFEPAEVGDVTC